MMRENLLYGPIPSEVAALPKLEIFDVAENALTGNLPYFSSGQLDKLDISRNKLSGFIPSNLGHNHELMTSLDVMHNRMSGPLPPSLDRMKNLELLSISNNGFWGVLPTSLGNLPQLTFLYADNNNFVGPIPSNLARPLGSGGKGSLLEEIWVQQNELSGTLPASLADLSQLQSLYIDGNKFTGKVPGDLCSEDLNVDFFDGVAADMERNLCDSVACPVDTTSLEGVFPCSPCRSLHYNPYLGRTGKCIALGQRLILSHFYDATSQLGQWIGGSNWNDDKTPLCDFDGITCDSKDNVVEIKLPARGLTGTVPEEIGFLEYLEVLDVSDNQLTGFLPSDLRWAPLRKLDISGNRMKSVVPPMLCLKQGINGNGQNGDYNCQRIACPAGTFSPSGMMAGDYGEFFCVPCEDEDANSLGGNNARRLVHMLSPQKAINWVSMFWGSLTFLSCSLRLGLLWEYSSSFECVGRNIVEEKPSRRETTMAEPTSPLCSIAPASHRFLTATVKATNFGNEERCHLGLSGTAEVKVSDQSVL